MADGPHGLQYHFLETALATAEMVGKFLGKSNKDRM
jgi:hypothetical protein